MNSGKTRFDARKRKTHEQIIKAAELVIENDGLESLSLDRIAETADISRATLFNHMHTRDELLIEVLLPVFDDCIAMLEGIQGGGRGTSLEAIEDACVYMWKLHKGAICRPGSGRAIACIPILEKKHERMVALFIGLFDSLPESVELRLSGAKDSALLVFKTFISILDSVSGEDDGIGVFRECLSGLILKGAP